MRRLAAALSEAIRAEGIRSQIKRELSPWLEFGFPQIIELKPRSFPVHESNGTSGCRTLLATGNFFDSQPYASDMPITLLEIKTAFGPEDTAAMTTAFEEALKRLNVADREAPMATSVAKKIVRLAKRGECNPTRLTEGVISSFRANPIPM